MEISQLDMILRVVLAAVLGAGLGIEREMQHKTAGLRTHTLVAAGAALFTVAGASVTADGTDLTRIAAQVVVGIGFIGAGGMIKTGFTMTGITTAATLWLSAAVGVATGFGLYWVAVTTAAVALAAMIGFAPVRTYLRRGRVQPLEIEYHAGHGTLTPLFETLNALGAQVHQISMVETEGTRRMSCELVGVGRESMADIIASLRSREEVISVTGP
ncbi:MAG: MgtC/SapB family protein, partial [Actinobacteria bacterium]|nr:MgtC/SapB family protein [Actinomycetota bacterium]